VEWQSEEERRESKTLSYSSDKDALYVPVLAKTESVQDRS